MDSLPLEIMWIPLVGAGILALSYVALRFARTLHREPWGREFLLYDSGGGGTPFQPMPTRQQTFLCPACNSIFSSVQFMDQPTNVPQCPFCGAREAHMWLPDLAEPGEGILAEESLSATRSEAEAMPETVHEEAGMRQTVATRSHDVKDDVHDSLVWWLPPN